MFAIVISEKGGTQHREIFDKSEINVGRVQGNDLMLPKGNVSKRHARLLYRDGRFIVTDLKSTNGTYVNGRKISQATIVREGDKIYVGDFVLQVETSEGGAATGPVHPPPPRPPPPAPTLTHPAPAPAEAAPANWDSDSTIKRERLPGLREASEPLPRIPRDPGGSQTSAGTPIGTPASLVSDFDPLRESATPRRMAPSSPGSGPSARLSSPGARLATPRSEALTVLMQRVGDAVDLDPLDRDEEPDGDLLQRIERVVRDQAKALRADGFAAEPVGVEDLIHDAQAELFGLGPLDHLLEDEQVQELRITGHDRVTALRAGEPLYVDPPFSNETAVLRAVVRLCRRSSQPLQPGESMVQRRLPGGVLLSAVLAPTSRAANIVLIRKPRQPDLVLGDLVRNGTVSRAMATFLGHCVATRTNILVAGPAATVSPLLAALAASANGDDRTVTLQPVDELFGLSATPPCLHLPDTADRGAAVVRAAGTVRPDRLIVSPFSGHVAAETLALIGEGAEGVIAGVYAPSLRTALDRVVPELAAARPGLSPEAAARWLSGSFAVAIETAKLRDARDRVLRVSELCPVDGDPCGTRDIFTFAPERTAAGGSVEGVFSASGVVPHVAEELAARGVAVDSGLFKRERG
jgi:pilus assembly protein CpaF